MSSVVALYRYPLKGFTPEACDSLTVLDEGRIAGDRVLGIRFANSEVPDNAWSKKHEFVALVNTPGLACLNLNFNHKTLRLRITLKGNELVEAGLDNPGRLRIAAAIENYVRQLNDNPLAARIDRMPLRVVGDGISPRFQDNEAGQVTLHSRESMAAVAAAVGADNLSELRFRSNIAIAGLAAWEEQDWIGRKIRIGDVIFDVVSPKNRCLATHANPESGIRDLPILKTLTAVFGQQKPTFAIAMSASGKGGQIKIGDEVRLVD